MYRYSYVAFLWCQSRRVLVIMGQQGYHGAKYMTLQGQPLPGQFSNHVSRPLPAHSCEVKTIDSIYLLPGGMLSMIKRVGGLRTKLTFFYVWSLMKFRPQTSRTNGTNIHGGLIAEWYYSGN